MAQDNNSLSHIEQTGKKILVVEDNNDFQYILKQGFESKGILVVSATSGQEGLDAAKKEKPDLIVIDIDLGPGMDGITMANKIKEQGVNSQMVFLTNSKNTEHISEAIDVMPGSDYMVKADMDISAIVDRVQEKLGLKKIQ